METKFSNRFRQYISNLLNILFSKCVITGRRSVTRRNLQTSGMVLRRLAAGVEIDYEVEQEDTNTATMSALIESSTAAVTAAIVAEGYTGVAASAITFTDISPTALPTSAPTVLYPGAMAGVIIAVVVVAALLFSLGYYLYYIYFNQSCCFANNVDSDVIPPNSDEKRRPSLTA
jgi:hypothetical protein